MTLMFPPCPDYTRFLDSPWFTYSHIAYTNVPQNSCSHAQYCHVSFSLVNGIVDLASFMKGLTLMERTKVASVMKMVSQVMREQVIRGTLQLAM